MPVYFPGQTIVSGRQDTGTVLSNLLNAYDPSAQAFFTAAGITNDAQKDAVNTMVVGLKAASLWSPMLALYPFVGGNATAHSINLKNPAQYQITWYGTVTHNSNGVTGDGTTGRGDTGLLANTTTANSVSFGTYNRTNSTGGACCEIGAYDGNFQNQLENTIRFAPTDGAEFDNAFNGTAGRISVTVTDSSGLFSNSRTSSSSLSAYRNGALIGSSSGAQGTVANENFGILCSGAGATIEKYSSRNVAFAFIADGLDSTKNADLYTIVQAYQTALGRAV